MNLPNFHSFPVQKKYQGSSDKGYETYPDIKDFVFTSTVEYGTLNADFYAERKSDYPLSCVVMAGSDMPGVILYPEGSRKYKDAIPVFNIPVEIEPIVYRVYPIFARNYINMTLKEGTSNCGESTHAAPQIFDYVDWDVKLGIGQAEQTYSPWHFSLDKPVVSVAQNGNDEEVYFPTMILPFTQGHRDRNTASNRRSIKLTNRALPLPIAQLYVYTFDKNLNAVDTEIHTIHVGRYLNFPVRDAHYFRLMIYVNNATASTYSRLSFYVG